MKHIFILITLLITLSCTHQETGQQKKEEVNHTKSEIVLTKTIDSLRSGRDTIERNKKLYNIKMFNPLFDTLTIDTVVNFEYIEKRLEHFYKLNYPALSAQKLNDSCLIFKNDTLSLTIQTSSFNKSNDDFKLSNAWGTDGDLPKRQIASIELTHHSKSYPIKNEFYSNLYEPNIKISKENNFSNCYIIPHGKIILTMFNSDGAGAYTFLMAIDLKGRIIKKIVGSGF
jgi:hypothetical protein